MARALKSEVADLLKAYPNRSNGEVCSVLLSGERALIEALHGAGMKSPVIEQVIREKKGKRVSYQAVRRHCRGLCLCPKN